MDDLRHHHDHPRWAQPGATHPPLPITERPPISNSTISSSRAPAPLRIPRSANHSGQSNELVSQRSLQHFSLSSSSRSGPSHPNLAPTVAFPQPTSLRGRTPGTPGYGVRPSSSSGYARAELRGQTVSSARQQALNGFVTSSHPPPPRTAVPPSNDHRYLEPARNPHWSSESTPSRSTHPLERPFQAPLATQPHIQQAVSHSALQCRPGDVLQDSFQQGEQRRERVRELGPETDQTSASKASSVRSSDSSLHSPLSSRLVTEEFGERGYYHPPRHGLDRKSHTRRPNSARSSPSSECISPATEISLLSSTAGQKARFEDSSPSSSSLKDLGPSNPEDHLSSQLAYISSDVDSPSGPLVLTPTLLPQRSKEKSLRQSSQEGGYGDEGVSTVRADEISKELAARFSQLQMESNMMTRPSISDTTATRSPTSTSISNGTWRTSVSSNPTTVHSSGPEIFKNENPFGIIEDDDDDELVGTFVTPMKPSIVTTTAPLSTGKPKLTLKTDTADDRPVRPPRLAPPTTINQHHSASTSASSLMIPSASRRDGDRRTSFTGDDWAVRPAVDEVYEHLEEFFPHHDLDKPIDIGPPLPCSPISPSPSPSPQPSRLNGRARSIRVVAQEKKKLLKRGGPMSSNALSAGDINSAIGNGSQSALLRRKSTKLWGARIEEVVPGAMHLSIPSSIDETRSADRDEDPENFSFKWVKGELIGKGSFGQVYLALNATNGEMLAVKQVELPKTRSDRDDERQKSVVAALKSEIHLMRDLEHPNIVQYLGFEETTVYLSIFLEYIPGGSIGRCLRRHGAFELNVIKSFTSQVLEGLKYLHSLHILHRDLKADNLLVDLDGNCKISDFGISKKSDNIYQDNTQMSLQGSIFWMAPEVVHNPGKKGYSAKVDIWSLGCVVLEMFAGRRPWSDEEAIQAMFKLGAERLRPPVPSDVKLGRMSDHFLAQCFIVDPELRPTADRLTDHRFLELEDKTWRFEHSELYRFVTFSLSLYLMFPFFFCWKIENLD
ncbi:STE protein kinase [Melampsora americana]|nr:STE protein kinase [Melampsora americana]